MSITEALADLDPLGLVAVVRQAYGLLVEAPLWSLTDAQTLELVVELTAAAGPGAAARLRGVREVDTRGAATAPGAASTAAWLRGRCRDRGRAGGRRGVGGAGPGDRPGLDRLPASVDPATLAAAEADLLGHTATLDPAALGQLGRHLRYVLDPDGAAALAAEEARMADSREVFLTRTGSG